MLPSLAIEPPRGEHWIHEIRFDGYRTVLVIEFLDGKDLRVLALEERRAELRLLMPRSPKSRLQFSEANAASGPDVFASAERLGLEGIVSKRLGSHYRSGRVDTWRKVKCWSESALVLIGTALDKRSGAPVGLLAHQSEEALSFAGGAFLRPSKAMSGAHYANAWLV
jgi:ATP-dependent DNA ligase